MSDPDKPSADVRANGSGRVNGIARLHAEGNGRAQPSGEAGADAAKAYAEGVIEARLGRPAVDVLEATVVLEAWAGEPVRSAMSSALGLVSSDHRAKNAQRSIEPGEDREQQSVVAEGISLVLSIVCVAAWATPLSRDYGPSGLAHAIRLALPIAVALQWGLRSRYLGRPHALAILGRDGIALCALAMVAVALPLALIPRSGPVAATLVAIWVGGTIACRRGWGLVYATTLVVATVALDRRAPASVVLGSLAAFTLLGCLVGLLTRRESTDDRAGSIPRALLATMLGGCIGALLVADPTVGWGVHGLSPAISLLPSVIGSFWGGYYLWNLHDVIPRGLSGIPLAGASGAAMRGPAMTIFVGAIVRLIGTTVALSLVIVLVRSWTRGTDALSLFVAFGGVALVSLLIGLLESLSLRRAALAAAAAAVGAELAWHQLAWRVGIHWRVSGAALIVGATVGVLLALPPLIARLARSGRALATTLWIQ